MSLSAKRVDPLIHFCTVHPLMLPMDC